MEENEPVFLCPECLRELAREKGRSGVYWICRSCGGRLMSLPVFERGTTHECGQWVRGQLRKQALCESSACPMCERPMAALDVPYPAGSVPVRICRRCQVVWLSAAALGTLPAAEKAEKPLSPKAREALAAFENQRVHQLDRARTIQDLADGLSNRSAVEGPDRWWKYILAFLGLPVEVGGRPLSRPPLATWILAGVITIISLYAFPDLKKAVDLFGMVPSHLWRYGGLTLLTSFFLHGGFTHLLGNMYFLMAFGDNVEDFLGWPRYLLLILAATVVGGLLHAHFAPDADMACIGASGGISGVLMFYALKFPTQRLGIFVWMPFTFLFGFIRIPAFLYFMVWIGFQCLTARMQFAGMTHVSALAHLGGVAAGLVAWLVWRRLYEEPSVSLSSESTTA